MIILSSLLDYLFHANNIIDRLQSALSSGVIVVEASENSGTMHTVKFSKEQGKVISCYKHKENFQEQDKISGNMVMLNSEHVLGIDSTESIELFKSKLKENKSHTSKCKSNIDYEDYNKACEHLERESLILIQWKGNIPGHIIDKITLNLNNLDKVYSILGRSSKLENNNELLGILLKYKYKNDIVDNFISYIEERVRYNKSVKQYLDITDLNDTINVLNGLVSVLDNKDDIYIRVLSVKVYNDSKLLESYKNKISKIINDFSDKSNYYDTDSIFEEYHVLKNPRQIRIKGNIRILVGNDSVNIGCFKDGLGISSKDLCNIEFSSECDINKVITIENLATFNNYEEENSILIYTGGFTSSSVISMIKTLKNNLCKEINTNIKFLHWGDIDCGGFKIYKHMQESSGIEFKPMLMDINTFEQYKIYGKDLTKNDIINLNIMRKDLNFKIFWDVIDNMLNDNKKIEQESISI